MFSRQDVFSGKARKDVATALSGKRYDFGEGTKKAERHLYQETSCDFGEGTKRRGDIFIRKKDVISGEGTKKRGDSFFGLEEANWNFSGNKGRLSGFGSGGGI